MRKLYIVICFLIGSWTLSFADNVNVSFLVSDTYGKIIRKSADHFYSKNPNLKSKCNIRTFTTSSEELDLSYLDGSELIFIYNMGNKLSLRYEQNIKKAINSGARVYALNISSDDKTYRSWGVLFDPYVIKAFKHRGVENISNIIAKKLNNDFSLNCEFNKDIVEIPDLGIYHYPDSKIYTEFTEFLNHYKNYKDGNPWVGVYILIRTDLITSQNSYIDQTISYIENAGFNVLPIYGDPSIVVEKYFKDTKIDLSAIVTKGFWMTGVKHFETLRTRFSELDVPVLNSMHLSQNQAEWEDSKYGIDQLSRTKLVFMHEMIGEIQPSVISVTELDENGDREKTIVDYQLRKFVSRIKKWNVLQKKPNNEKKIALIYFSYPPGKGGVGASYLNVLPQSIQNILERMKTEDYDLGSESLDSTRIYNDIMSYGRNVGPWAQGEIDRMVNEGEPILVPISLYKKWYSHLNLKLRSQVEAKWGRPEDNKVMSWTDENKEKYMVLPAVRYGNILLTTQPARAFDEEESKSYHDKSMPPHHQYIAFYLYLKYGYKADALIHLGTHGTVEWLAGKSLGLNDDDAPEALISDMPNIYPYIVDDVGEGLQAKRRTGAVIVDYLTPPYDKAGLNPDLRELSALISDYEVAMSKSPVLAEANLISIKEIAKKIGILKALKIEESDEAIKENLSYLEHYIKEISEKQVPLGLHTFGEPMPEKYAHSTAEAIVSQLDELSKTERKEMYEDLKKKLLISGESEMNSLMRALEGGYIRSGKGNDPLRNPASLPTGKNFYTFDPQQIPSRGVYATGKKMAEQLLLDYKEENEGEYPKKITLNLWSNECIRHEGVMESQILYLMGLKPKYDGFNRVVGVEVIPKNQLNRPRIDITIVPSGLYKDLFPNLMKLLDEAVQKVKELDEADNYVREHIAQMKEILMKKAPNIDPDLAEKLASVRMFTVPSGTYGTGIADVLDDSGSWEDSKEVADVYFERMSHLYGQGFWGNKIEDLSEDFKDGATLDIFQKALSGTDVVMHSRSSNLYNTLDTDDFFQYLGGTALAISSVDGKTPKVVVSNLSNPNNLNQESLEKFMTREMHSRYLNPLWVEEMLEEGYAGARMVNKVVFNLWGWQVTVPESVSDDTWNQFYEVYVEDKYDLDIEETFREAGNLYAYQAMLSRMIETVRKDYWDAEPEVLEKMLKEYNETIAEVGLSCNLNVCDNAKLADFVAENVEQIKGLSSELKNVYKKSLKEIKKSNFRKNPSPSSPNKVAREEANTNRQYDPTVDVQGYQMEELRKTQNKNPEKAETNEGKVRWDLIILIALFLISIRFTLDRS